MTSGMSFFKSSLSDLLISTDMILIELVMDDLLNNVACKNLFQKDSVLPFSGHSLPILFFCIHSKFPLLFCCSSGKMSSVNEAPGGWVCCMFPRLFHWLKLNQWLQQHKNGCLPVCIQDYVQKVKVELITEFSWGAATLSAAVGIHLKAIIVRLVAHKL